MRANITILLLAVLLLTACNPLRKVQRNQKADSTLVDQSEIHKVVTDILRESGTLRQTVVEFYPPVVVLPEGNMDPDESGPQATGNDAVRPASGHPATNNGTAGTDAALSATERTQSPPPAIKRIVRTEIAAESERTTTTDSLAHNDIHRQAHSELEEKVVEKPPAGTQAVKWIAAGLVALLLIIVILKFSKIKIPFSKLWQSRD